MKEIKAYIHRNRIADVVCALEQAGYRNLPMIYVKGMLNAPDRKEQEYSIEADERKESTRDARRQRKGRSLSG